MNISKIIKIAKRFVALALILAMSIHICSQAVIAKSFDKTISDIISDYFYEEVDDISEFINDLALKNFTYLYSDSDETVYLNGLGYNYENGQLKSIIDVYGHETHISFDSDGYLKQISSVDGIIDIETNSMGRIASYKIHDTEYCAEYEYDEKGILESITHNSSRYNISYDENDEPYLTINDKITTQKTTTTNDSSTSFVYFDEYTGKLDLNKTFEVAGEFIQREFVLDDITGRISKIIYSSDIVVEAIYHDGLSDSSISFVDSDGDFQTIQSKTELFDKRDGELKSLQSIAFQQYDDEYRYDLNSKGFIDYIYCNNKLIRQYEYDTISGQLLAEYNYETNEKIWHEYDFFGNIMSRLVIDLTFGSIKSEYKYEYDNGEWKDQLTRFNGQDLEYDDYGNLLNLGDYSFCWDEKLLSQIQSQESLINYTYNRDGIRNFKIINGELTEYVLDGRKVVAEINTNDCIVYIYSNEGIVVGFVLNGDTYMYKLNQLNDVIGIYDDKLNLVVEYVYDAWGNILATDGELADSVGRLNPYRYRGYRYDNETNLYYLNNRYYSPELARFISADTYEGLIGGLISHNLYAYCANNPIMYTDYSGNSYAVSISLVGYVLAFTMAVIMALILWSVIFDSISFFVNAISSMLSAGFAYASAIANEIGESIRKANLSFTGSSHSPFAVHHIVAESDTRAQGSRNVLMSNTFTVNMSANLVAIRQSLHALLHTSLYHQLVYWNLLPYYNYNYPTINVGYMNYILSFLSHMRNLLSRASALCP